MRRTPGPVTLSISEMRTDPEFGESNAEIAKAEGDIGVFGIKFAEQPRRRSPRTEQLDHGLVVDACLRAQDDTRSTLTCVWGLDFLPDHPLGKAPGRTLCRTHTPHPGILSPIAILDKARQAVPAVNYALGLAGVAAAAAIVTALVGRGTGGVIVIGSSFVGMILLFVFSRLVVSASPSIQFGGIVLVWVIIMFFSTFLVFTTTAVVFTWPCNWAQFLDMTSNCTSIKSISDNPTVEQPAGPETPPRLTHFVIKVTLQSGALVQREWNRLTPDEWVEKYSDTGTQTYYDVKGRLTLDGCPGTKVANKTAGGHLAFLPDKGCPGMPFRINDNNGGWGIAASLTDYE